MEEKKGFGCLAILGLGLVIWLFSWIIKVGSIVLGIALILLPLVFGTTELVKLWKSYRESSMAMLEVQRFGFHLERLESLSIDRLSSEMSAWDQIQLTRGVGTTIEKEFYEHAASEQTHRLLARVNDLMDIGTSVRESQRREDGSTPLQARVFRLREADATWVSLEQLRRQVTIGIKE